MKHERSGLSAPATMAKEQTYTLITAILAALLIAASNVGQPGGASLLSGYAYWVGRIAIESALFILVRDAIERNLAGVRSAWRITGAAMLISLLPFVLAITALDIVLGYPELGAENAAAAPSSKVKEFGLELIFLLDNHLILCILLTIPRLLLANEQHQSADTQDAREMPDPAQPSRAKIFTQLNPPLKGELLWVAAQEHYVRLTTSEETRMALLRFADVLRDLPGDTGIQVHRSHWVSIDAIKEVFREGANLRLRLRTNDVVPVSRTHRAVTERRLREAKLIV